MATKSCAVNLLEFSLNKLSEMVGSNLVSTAWILVPISPLIRGSYISSCKLCYKISYILCYSVYIVNLLNNSNMYFFNSFVLTKFSSKTCDKFLKTKNFYFSFKMMHLKGKVLMNIRST